MTLLRSMVYNKKNNPVNILVNNEKMKNDEKKYYHTAQFTRIYSEIKVRPA